MRKKELVKMFKETFTDRYGKADPKALTAFISFNILVASWFFNMFFEFSINDLMIEIFAFLVFSLLGLKVLPWGKKDAITQHEELNNTENERELN